MSPLKKGSSKKAIASRFKELYADNKKSGKEKKPTKAMMRTGSIVVSMKKGKKKH